jgi:benzoate-CoA ligase family protein
MIKGEQFEVPLAERLNLGSYYLDINLEAGRGDKTAIYYQDKTYSFFDLWRLTNRVGNVLKTLGVETENRVLLILEDSPEWVAAWLATMKIGAVGTHAYTYLTADDYEHLLNLVKPKVVVVDKTTREKVRQGATKSRYPKAFLIAGEKVPDLKPGEEFSLAEMIEGAGDRLEVEPTHRDDLAFWNFSGGTTGKPKGVPHMHRDSVLSYHSFSTILGYKTDDIVLLVPKLFFHYARDNGLLFALRSGAVVILFGEKATAALIFQLIAKYRPTVMLNVPTMMRAMIQTPKDDRADLSCLRLCLSSGEVLSPQLYKEWISTFGTEVIDRLGSAESGMGYLCNRVGAVRPGSSGTVTPLAEIKLVDPEGAEVRKGEPGLLLTRSDASAQYYVREHEKSKVTFLGDEWINTGDIFLQDDDDYFWYVGRADETVKVSGVWVSPLEIERTLHECARVKECAVLGIKNRDGLMKIQTFVVLNDGARPSTDITDELKRFCSDRLPPHKVPKIFEFLDELPKTGQGKIDRRLLREGLL